MKRLQGRRGGSCRRVNEEKVKKMEWEGGEERKKKTREGGGGDEEE